MKKLFFALLLTIISVTSVEGQKLGHVQSQKVLDTIPSRKAAIKDIQMIEQNGIAELTGMDSTIQAKDAFIKSHPEWTEAVKQSQIRALQEMYMRFQARQEAIDQELQVLTNELNKKSLGLVKDAVSSVSKAKGLNYVIDESVLLYNSGGTDITNDVIKEVLILDAKK